MQTRVVLPAIWLATLFVSTTAFFATAPAAPAPDAGVTLGVRDAANANPSVAANGSFVAVAFGASVKAGDTDVYVVVSRNAGGTFGTPVRVNDVIGDARLSGEQPPRVSLVTRRGADPLIAVVWTTKSAAGTRLLTARSSDGGRSFSRSSPVPGGDAAGNRGWEATAIDRDGHVVAVWLDHRELSTAGGSSTMHHEGQQHTGHAAPTDGTARAQLSKLYFGRVDGSDQPQVLTGGVCYCCKTSIAAGSDGSIYAAWRHVYPGNTRDIAFTVSRDLGRTFLAPLRVSDDRWVLDGCPENGPSIAVDRRNRVHLAWPTLVSGPTRNSEPTLALFYATSTDARQFSARERIPTEGVPRHPQLAIDSAGSVVGAWDEQEGGVRRVVLGRAAINGSGPRRFTREVLEGSRTGVYPALASVGDGVLVVWTTGPPERSVLRAVRAQ